MKFVSPSLEKSFLKQTLTAYLLMIGSGFFLGFIFVLMILTKPDPIHKGKLNRIISSLEHVARVDCLYACVAGIFLACVFAVIFKIMDKPEKVVVYIDFDDALQKLHIKTRNSVKNNIEDAFILYAQLNLKGKYESNVGYKKDSNEGIEIQKNHVYQGIVLDKHFTWEIEEFIRIKTKLVSISKLS